MSKAPSGLGRRGKATWTALTGAHEFDAHEGELLAEVCRVLDVLDALDAVVQREGLTVEGGKVQPAAVQARQQRRTPARLMRDAERRAGVTREDGEHRVGVVRAVRVQSYLSGVPGNNPGVRQWSGAVTRSAKTTVLST